MATGITKIADIVVPEVFLPYVQQLTERKDRLIQSGIVTSAPFLDAFLGGGGLTVNVPSFQDLDQDDDNVSTDDETTESTPSKIGTSTEVAVRLSRNKSWSSMDLTAALAGPDPMDAIASRVAKYWLGRRQAMFIATMNGVFADNDAAPAGTEHVQGDLSNDVSGAGFIDGMTNFSAEVFLDAAQTMGDSQDDLGGVLVHSVVYNRMKKNNLIDFIPDARGEVMIATFLGKEVIVDDSMPNTGGVFDTWIFGSGAVALGNGAPKVPVEIERFSLRGNGGGQEVLTHRNEYMYHPVGHAYVGPTTASGGPTNAVLQAATSFQRVYPERKQIKVARLVTREF